MLTDFVFSSLFDIAPSLLHFSTPNKNDKHNLQTVEHLAQTLNEL
jgi:hypothetical protein